MKNQSARGKFCPSVTLSTTDLTWTIFPLDLGHDGKRKMVTNHHTMSLGKYFLTSQRITVLTRSRSRRRTDVQDRVYYIYHTKTPSSA